MIIIRDVRAKCYTNFLKRLKELLDNFFRIISLFAKDVLGKIDLALFVKYFVKMLPKTFPKAN
jgi:hypothetical protein